MQCYTTQRDPRVFPSPNSFSPERWLKPDGMSTEAKTLFMPFSSGPRTCLGKNLAMMELNLITSVLFRRFHVHLAPGTTEDSMTLTDHFLAMPKAGKCELVFIKV
jgi:cytochrome P450